MMSACSCCSKCKASGEAGRIVSGSGIRDVLGSCDWSANVVMGTGG